MAARSRQSIATPSSSRAGAGVSAASALPAYEPPTFSLDPKAQHAIADLSAKYKLKKLEDKLVEARTGVSNAACAINDRLIAREDAAKRRKPNPPATSGEPEVDHVVQRLDAFRDKVDGMTDRMEVSVRDLIDSQFGVQHIKDSLAATAQDARANASTQASTLGARSQRRRRVSADGEAGNAEEGEEAYEDFDPTDPTTTNAQSAASCLDNFRKTLQDEQTRYKSHPLSRRYADNNDYRQFYQLVHDARHPHGDVQMPHRSEWFAEGDTPVPGLTSRAAPADANDDDGDEEMTIERASIRTKCPLTLQEFKKPLTSKKCPHIFEADAILGMISQSVMRVNGQVGARGQIVGGERAVPCPMQGCTETLTKDDVELDEAMLRKIRRVRERAREEEEDGDGDEEAEPGATHRNATLIDDDGDGEDVDKVIERQATQQKLKKEKARSTAGTTPPVNTTPITSQPSEVEISDEEEA